MHALRPAYNPPHRHLLAGKLLDQTHEKIEKRKVKSIEKMDKKVTSMVGKIHQQIVTTSQLCLQLQMIKRFCWNHSTFQLSEKQESIFLMAIVLAKERYGAVVYAILTDNAFNMQSMGDDANEYLGILYLQCSFSEFASR